MTNKQTIGLAKKLFVFDKDVCPIGKIYDIAETIHATALSAVEEFDRLQKSAKWIAKSYAMRKADVNNLILETRRLIMKEFARMYEPSTADRWLYENNR